MSVQDLCISTDCSSCNFQSLQGNDKLPWLKSPQEVPQEKGTFKSVVKSPKH